MESASDIRKAFLDYFAAHGHQVVASSPLVPHNDPTLMFVNSGMVQFKNVFTGAESRDYDRATTSQKCVRAGGKHNDLDNVGYTARHHTFFEMLGNFSFGDYFKDLAIELAWNLVTREFGLSPERLWITVYHDDDDAFTLWRKISGLPEARIVRIPTAANFWAMGETGPCGPCSEIFYDHGPELAGGPPGSADQDGDRYVEIWNLVFMQFEQVTPERRIDLPRPSVDTGMGLDRDAAVLQGKHDNYDTDLLRALILASAEASGAAPDGEHAVAHRVIADHLRASSFLIADGVTPSNEGRGYVLRRIMRRAMRHAQLMGCAEPLMWRLVPALVAQMGQVFPELARAEPLIAETLKLEEGRFKQTLARGLRFLDEAAAELGAGDELSGAAAFRLYDTYGCPLDLTQDALRGRGVAVDTEGFDQAMARQRAEARAAWAGSGASATEAIWLELRDELGASEFLGYTTERAEGVVWAIIVEGARATEAGDGVPALVILNQTPFYAEAGGQVGDSGVMVTEGGVEFVVEDTRKQAEHLFVHSGTVHSGTGKGGTLKLGDAVEMRVDGARRQALRLNHSATHLLHEALRRSLGDHVTQKGSLVAPDRLRFDFSHAKAMSAEELAAVEAEVNRRIRDNAEVVTHLMAPDEAVRAGALALFGEKYGEEVRVVSMGEVDGGEDDGASFSTELCGGTHLRRTGDI
ncbi:MAG: alanine--tRNA ligase, partial [Alphaproteobacteria bacterium]|nr:alanine--tRNA ligase [Alphaproteobacteria bacterium]